MGHPNAFDGMMHEFCAIRGYCGGVKDGKPMHVSNFIPEAGPVSADQFARWLVVANGFDLNRLSTSQFRHLIGELASVFVKHMGADVVDASNLRSERRGA
jgi:hypothetical protein